MPRIADDQAYLARLQVYYARHRSLPSYTRLAGVLGLAAKSGVKKVLERLAQQGYLTRTQDAVWTPAERFFDRPLVQGAVPAGPPLHIAEVPTEPFAIDAYLVGNPDTTLLVPVKGDSMIEAGIHDGDLAVVERRGQAAPGELVVAVVDGALTLKRLGVENGACVLIPANPHYAVIHPRGELQLCGVVVGIVRKY